MIRPNAYLSWVADKVKSSGMEEAERWRLAGRVLNHRSPELFERLIELAEAAASEFGFADPWIDEISIDA